MKHSRIMGITTSFLFFFSIAVKAEFKVVGYLYNWGNFVSNANSVDYAKVTHINIAFLNPDNSGNIGDTANLRTVINIIHNHNVKALVSFGGEGSPDSWATVMAADQRPNFIPKIISLINKFNLDGVDIDLEGSAVDGNYNDFIVDLKAQMPQGKLLTAAIASYNYDIYDATLSKFDFVNVMSYDYCGTWSEPCQHSSIESAKSDIYHWHNERKLPLEKVILGLPSYGYSWEAGKINKQFTYKTIVNAYPRASTQDSIHTNSGGIIYHNSIPTIKQKTAYAMLNAGGIMWWALPYDYPTSDSRSLLRAMGEITNSVNEAESVHNVEFYPNPVSSAFTLNFSNSRSGKTSINLYDLTGKNVGQLYNNNIAAGNFSENFNLDFLPAGMYTCMIISNESAQVIKLIKE
ncbi:MAG: glycosyl hydrolase family 18 protein [Bacteroidetes bacterium]|nr:glycosyl hydrolase family 18 protein [Bacteroidota bacterium]